MATFKDKSGRSWTIDLTIADVKRVKSRLGINLANLLAGEAGELPLVTRLAMDVALRCDVIWVLVELQAAAGAPNAGITDEQFGEALGGSAIRDASNALEDASIDFFTSQGQNDVAEAIRKQREMKAAAVTAGLEQYKALEPTKIVAEEIAKALADRADGKSQSNAPASSDANPTAGRLGS